MSLADDVNFIRLRDAFLGECRKIEPYQWRQGLRKSQRLVDELKADIVEAFNALINYLIPIHESGNLNEKLRCAEAIQPFVDKIKQIFEILDLQYNWQENPFELIDIALIVPAGPTADDPELDDPSIAQDDNNIAPVLPNIDQNNLQNLNLQNEQENQENMAQTRAEFIKLSRGMLPDFNGDPLELDGFLIAVEMVDDIAHADNKEYFRKMIKSHLKGRALECLPAQTPTLESITDALKENCKPESSDVVAGKIMALKVRKGNFTEFTTQAEKLAESFRRGLTFEGIPKDKAEELAVKKTVELCRKTARSETVKAVVSSTSYKKPSEVLAKLVTENDIASKEKKEADAYRANQQNRGNNSRGNGRGRFNGRGNGRGGYNNNGNRYNNNGNNSNNGNSNQGQNRQNNYGNNYRGNGNGNGNYRQNRGNYRNQNEHTIRFVSGNPMGPNPGQLQQQNQQQEQVFHVPFQ